MDTSDKIRENLIRYRGASGLSQEALAEAAGLSTMAVTLIETGRRKTPGIGTVAKLARALGVSIDMLAGAEDPKAAKTRAADSRQDFLAAAEILTKISSLSPDRQKAVLAVIQGRPETAGARPLAQAVAALLKVC